MNKNITSRLELLLAKIAGRDVDLSTMTPPVAMNLTEELMLDIADRMDGASSELPTVTATDNGDVLTVVEGAWAKAAPTGGGAYIVTVSDGEEEQTKVLDKNWTEINTAIRAGQIVMGVEITDDDPEFSVSVNYLGSVYCNESDGYVVDFNGINFSADTATGVLTSGETPK